jgi:hypothetical protein
VPGLATDLALFRAVHRGLRNATGPQAVTGVWFCFHDQEGIAALISVKP